MSSMSAKCPNCGDHVPKRVVRLGRASLECPDCGRAVMLEMLLLEEAAPGITDQVEVLPPSRRFARALDNVKPT